jgi:hypothetical protein
MTAPHLGVRQTVPLHQLRLVRDLLVTSLSPTTSLPKDPLATLIDINHEIRVRCPSDPDAVDALRFRLRKNLAALEAQIKLARRALTTTTITTTDTEDPAC